MPTNVSPDDPNATGAARLQAMVGGPRDPGSPSMAGKPGVQAGRTSFPAPPAPAAGGLPGRPAQPAPAPVGGRAAMSQSSQPGTPAPGAGLSPAAPSQAAAPPPTPGSSPPAPGAGSQRTTGVGAPAAPPPPSLDAAGGMATQTFTSPTIPPAGTLAPGAAVQTPYGTASTGPDGAQRLALDAAGQQKYKETVAALRNKFATPRVMKGMTGLPQMELKLGASNFDPWSGRFHGRE